MNGSVIVYIGRKGVTGLSFPSPHDEDIYEGLGLLMRIKPEIETFRKALRKRLVVSKPGIGEIRP